MAWENAVALSVLGSGALLIYLASNIKGEELFEGKFPELVRFLKMLLFGVSISSLLYSSTLSYHLFTANNGTMNANVSANIEKVLVSHIQYTDWAMYGFIVFMLIGYIVMVLMAARNAILQKKEKKGQLDLDEEED